MPATKQEPRGAAGNVKAERDPDLARAMRMSLLESQKVKAEQRPGVKTEQRANVKAEKTSVKTEPARVKAERGAATTGVALPPLKAKVEQLRQLGAAKIKAELLRKADAEEGATAGSVADIVARGLKMRAANSKVKKEKTSTGKVKKLIKVKKERTRNADGSLRKKPRKTAKMRRARKEVMAREITLSQELGEVLGADALSRPEAVRRLWAYCKDNNMINPENRREIIFDTKMEAMLGTKTASMTGMMGLLVPHLDYTKPVVKQEMKQETKKERGSVMKMEAKKEMQQNTMKHETKRELKAEPSAGSKKAKQEPGCSRHEEDEDTRASTKEALGAAVPQISSFDHTSAVVVCVIPQGKLEFEAVAKPCLAGKPELRKLCSPEFCENREGKLELHAEAKLVGLDPKLAYLVRVQLRGETACSSHEVSLPQRSTPAQWSPRDVTTWCQAQHVPELVRMAQEYGIDGKTLLSMGEDDLKASGLAAPFLLRRTLASLQALRGAAAAGS
jgi:chromatin remodeling complex protein RSC6